MLIGLVPPPTHACSSKSLAPIMQVQEISVIQVKNQCPAPCLSTPAGAIWGSEGDFHPDFLLFSKKNTDVSCRWKEREATLACRTRLSRGLCVSAAEYSSQAAGGSKPLCAITTTDAPLFKIRSEKNPQQKPNKKTRGEEDVIPDLLTSSLLASRYYSTS